jgi:outer membrane protein TolC
MKLHDFALAAAMLAVAPGVTLAQAPNPFLGSAPPAGAVASPTALPLSLQDAVTRGLEYNLGLLLREAGTTEARGARWRALEGLLPDVNGSVNERRQVLNLAVFGLPVEPAIVGPFNVFDARLTLSQPVIDLSALNRYKAASLDASAADRGMASARDMVVLVSVSLYLQAISAASRIDVARAQLETADALAQQASDLLDSGLVARVDALRAQVQVQNGRRRLIEAENSFEKAKLQLGRAVGLPPGQDITLTDDIPYAPLEDVTVESALQRAYDTRADFLAARDRLAAAEATKRAATTSLLPTLHFDADYGTIGTSTSDAHPTYTISATVRMPVFEAGRAQARKAEADALLQRRQAELEDLRGQVDLEVRSSLLDLRSAAQQLEAARTARSLADQELTQARDRFAAGVASNIEVTQAQEAVAAAAETYIDALYAHNVAKASLAHAVGIAESAVMQYLGGGAK